MDGLNPLDLPGPQFLLVFGVLAIAGFVLSAVLRKRAGPQSSDAGPTSLDPFEVAHLAGGEPLALNTALASLYRRDLIAVDREAGTMTVRDGQSLPFDLHPVEREAFDTIKRFGTADAAGVKVVATGMPSLTALDARLRSLGLRFRPGEYASYGLRAAVPIVAVIVLGGIKILMGLQRGYPVSILVVFVVVTLLVALWVMFSAPQRTRRGEQVLKDVRHRHAALESTAKTAPTALGAPQLAMAFALFGPAVLIGSQFDPLRNIITPPGTSSSGSSCSTGSSSSSSDSGGGDSGGGGGCGGCGGGGGD